MDMQIVESRERVEDGDVADSCDAVRVSVLVCKTCAKDILLLMFYSLVVIFYYTCQFLSNTIIYFLSSRI